MSGTVRKQFSRRRQNFKSTEKSYPELPYVYKRILSFSKASPKMRQFRVRNDLARVSPGLVGMSNAMKAAYMRVFKMFDKHIIRKSLIDVVPIIVYRMEDNRRHLFDNKTAEDMLPKDAPSTLNEVKKQMFERREEFDGVNKSLRFVDAESHARLRRNIKQKIMRFHRKADLFNSMEKRNVSPDPKDSTSYHLFRAAAIYAAVYRVFHELSKMMPFFVPRSVLDFGTGTGVALLALKEIYDPQSMVRPSPTMAHLRHTFFHNANHRKHTFAALSDTFTEIDAFRTEQKKKRFMAVIGLLHQGDILLDDIPSDLRQEIVDVGIRAVREAKRKQVTIRSGVASDIGTKKWSEERFETFESNIQEMQQVVSNREASNDSESTSFSEESAQKNVEDQSWWEKLVESQKNMRLRSVSSKLKPLQSIIGIEPSQGMIEIAMVNLAEELPNVFWRSSIGPNEPDAVSDLVVAAYTFSEIATKKAREEALLRLWKHTGKVLVVIDHGNVPGFSVMMEIRDTILEMKNCGTWDSQPTIVGPCPHEYKCPMQHSCAGNKYPNLRVCNSSVAYELTFIERWIYRTSEKKGKEHFTYLIIARNENIPNRKERARTENMKNDQTRDEVNTGPSKTPSDIEKTTASGEVEKDFNPRNTTPSDGMWNPLPVPQHVYNRSLSWETIKNSDSHISTNKGITIQNEVEEYEKYHLDKLHNFYRITSEPHGRGYANFCKPNGDLVRARVRKYFSGKKGSPEFRKRYTTKTNWQHVGGYSLLMRSMKGGLIPADIPLSREKKFLQQENPNTFVDDSEATPMEKTSMILGSREEHEDSSSIEAKEEPGKQVSMEVVQNAVDMFAQGNQSNVQYSTPSSMKKIDTEVWKRKIQSTRRSLRDKMRLRHVNTNARNLKDPKKPAYVP